MTTTDPDQRLGQLVPELAALDEREADVTAKFTRIHEAMEAHRDAARKWQAARHTAALAGEPEPSRPDPPYSDSAYATRVLMDQRLEVQRQRRQVLRERYADVLAGVIGRLEPMLTAAAAPARKLAQLAEQAASLHTAATQACESAGLQPHPPFTADALGRAALTGRPLLQPPSHADTDLDPTPAAVGNPLLQRAQRVG